MRATLTRDMWWLGLSLLCRGLGLGLYMMLWPLYVERLGGNSVSLGTLAAVGSVAGALGLLPGGVLADRVDRRTMVITGALLALPAPFLFWWASSWIWLLPGVILFAAAGLARPAVQAIVVEEAPRGRLSSAYSLVMSAFEAGMVVGPPVGAWLATRQSFHAVLLASGSVFAVSLLFAVMLHPHAARRGQRHAGFWTLPRRAPRYLRWLLFGAGFALIQGVAQPFVVPYWRNIGHLSVETIGWLGSATILAATLAGPLWGRLADRLGYVKSLGIGLAATAAGWIVLALWPASVGLGLAGAVLRGTEEGCSTVAGSAVGRTVGSDRAGTAYGLYNLASELARAAGPVPGGLAYEGRPPIPFLASAFLTAAIAWLFLDTLPEGSPPPRA